MYHALPFVDLTPLDAMNDAMRDIQNRRACTLAMNRLRGIHVRKQEVPAIISLYQKVVGKRGPVVKKTPANRIKKVAEKFQGPQVSSAKGAGSATERGKSAKLISKLNDINNSQYKSSEATPVFREEPNLDQSESDSEEAELWLDNYVGSPDIPNDFRLNESRAHVKSVSFV